MSEKDPQKDISEKLKELYGEEIPPSISATLASANCDYFEYDEFRKETIAKKLNSGEKVGKIKRR